MRIDRALLKRQVAASRTLLTLIHTRSLRAENAATDTEQAKDALQRLEQATEELAREVYAVAPATNDPARDEFDAWIKSTVGDAFSARRPDGRYVWDVTERDWRTWQAAMSTKIAHADMFWDAEDPEQCEKNIHNLLIEVYSNRGLEVGDEVEIQRAMSLPNITVRITSVEDDEGDGELTWEECLPNASTADDPQHIATVTYRNGVNETLQLERNAHDFEIGVRGALEGLLKAFKEGRENAAIGALVRKMFASGNDIPVDRVTISRAHYEDACASETGRL